MTDRREFIKTGLILGAGLMLLRGTPVWGVGRKEKTDGRKLLGSFPKRSPYFDSRPDGDGLVLVPLGGGEPVYRLNRVAGAIWEACDGRHNPKQIAEMLTRRFEVSEDVCLRDTLELLSVLYQEGLISL
ncbi:MAG: hypothetical protein DRP95_01495 [Candidatus Latescibacterota bacterium]|nr:MAG: hypothetical protein DRP95_01495 [Candidatus Latescibacterota bacterium]